MGGGGHKAGDGFIKTKLVTWLSSGRKRMHEPCHEGCKARTDAIGMACHWWKLRQTQRLHTAAPCSPRLRKSTGSSAAPSATAALWYTRTSKPLTQVALVAEVDGEVEEVEGAAEAALLQHRQHHGLARGGGGRGMRLRDEGATCRRTVRGMQGMACRATQGSSNQPPPHCSSTFCCRCSIVGTLALPLLPPLFPLPPPLVPLPPPVSPHPCLATHRHPPACTWPEGREAGREGVMRQTGWAGVAAATGRQQLRQRNTRTASDKQPLLDCNALVGNVADHEGAARVGAASLGLFKAELELQGAGGRDGGGD